MPAADIEAVLDYARHVPRNRTRITPNDWSFQGTVKNQLDMFAEYQVETPHSIIPETPIDIHIPAYEKFMMSGNEESPKTLDLTYDLVDAPSVVDDFVLYSNGNRATEDSLDYSNNSFNYTGDGTIEELEVFYLCSDQAEVVLRLQAPKNFDNEPLSVDAGRLNLRDQGREPLTFEPSNPFEGLIPTDYTVQWYLNAPYSFRFEGSQFGATADNLMLDLPVWRTDSEIPGLKPAKRNAFR
jgi:hypothetical protein